MEKACGSTIWRMYESDARWGLSATAHRQPLVFAELVIRAATLAIAIPAAARLESCIQPRLCCEDH
jgi:hypothetical protein